jgi:hypothetical protein
MMPPSGLKIALLIGVGMVLLRSPAVRAADDLTAAWADLASADEVKAARALLALSATPKETTALLAKHLKPVKADSSAIAKLVKDLDSDDVKTRDAASQELEYLGKYAKAELEKHRNDTTSAEVKKRIGDVMDKMPTDEKTPAAPPQLKGSRVGVQNNNGNITIIIDGKALDLTTLAPPPPPAPNLKWLRVARATVLLEHLGTPEARQILERVADGEAEAPPTKAAREALQRLKAK